MLKVAICDDEAAHRKKLVNIIQMSLEAGNIEYSVSEFNSGEELLLYSEVFDIYFLDIKMYKLSGIETAKKIRLTDHKAGIIFVTALKEYVFEAFDINAFHYLLKPIDENKVKKVLNSFLACNDMTDNFIIVKTSNQVIKIFFKEIIYIEARLRIQQINVF